MVNEAIIGGLMSALSRGESLEKSMMSFYNAGYQREEIEEAAKTVYSQMGAQLSKTGSLQETFNTVALKVGLTNKNTQNAKKEIDEEESEESSQENFQGKQRTNNPPKKKEKSPQKVSNYGESNYGQSNQSAEQIANKIERAVRDLKQINVPSKIEIINKSVDSKSPTVIQKISGYGDGPPKPVSKFVTYLLVFLLIFLLGVLAAVFLFKDELIRMFNNIGLS